MSRRTPEHDRSIQQLAKAGQRLSQVTSLFYANPEGEEKALADALEEMEQRTEAYEESKTSVYFARSGDRIKIGFTGDLDQRMACLSAMSCQPVTLLTYVPGGREKESHFHRRFAALRLHGEWFVASESMLRFIDHTESLRQAMLQGPVAACNCIIASLEDLLARCQEMDCIDPDRSLERAIEYLKLHREYMIQEGKVTEW